MQTIYHSSKCSQINANSRCAPSVLLTQAGLLGTLCDTRISYPKTRIPNVWFCNKKRHFLSFAITAKLAVCPGENTLHSCKAYRFFFFFLHELLFSDAEPNLVFSFRR